nr:alpha/beta hydrolase [Candidatus Sigynarchaeota archaeon]
MENVRLHGHAPFCVALVHGGPGASGEMVPVARVLSARRGVLEPLQTETTVQGQIRELKDVLARNGSPPVTLVGFSWGAWLSILLAAKHPALVEKLILVSSGPFEEKYATGIQETRLRRLSEAERTEVRSLQEILGTTTGAGKAEAFARFGALFSKSDAYDALPDDPAGEKDMVYSTEIYQGVWPQAAEMRRSGKLLAMVKTVKCPVVAIHGDHDPHPAEGVRKPLEILKDFRFILLQKCGHRPWIEKEARDKFYEILDEEIG